MNPSRRIFLSQATVVAGTVVLAKRISHASLSGGPDTFSAATENGITIYHTNSINGNVGPVYKNAGGLRNINTHLLNDGNTGLLLDAGNFLTLANSVTQQQQVVAAMNSAGYRATGISGLDVSGGGHLAALSPLMQFSLINCNHRFAGEVKPFIKPYHVFKNGSIKIGVTAVCAPVKGAYYKNAIDCANRTARFLKENEGCHLVVCLSDLGHKLQNPELNDEALAKASEHIDLIIGNDHGKIQANHMVMRNKLKQEVIFSASAGNGLTIGKIVVNFSADKTKNGVTVEHQVPGKPAGQKIGAAMRELSLS